jgi:hypothetical protein
MKNKVPPARVDEIRQLAEQIAIDHCTAARAIDPILIIDRKGITLSFGRYGGFFDGMLECRAGLFHIYCNLDRVEHSGSSRARFTLAHELGHYFIDEHRRALLVGRALAHPSRCEFESDNVAEREADLFASNLLMPPGQFLAAATEAPRGLPGILALARRFKTSVTSTALRYAECNLAPCVVLKWTQDGFAWKWLSGQVFEAGYRKTVESLSALPRDSATAEALSGVEPPAKGFFERGSTAALWFPHVDPRSARNCIMVEQALSLGRFGTLTVLLGVGGDYGSPRRSGYVQGT